MLCVAFALAAFGATTQTWLDADVSGAAVRTSHLEVQGSKAATAVSALALVGLAGTLAAAVAGRIGRVVAGAVVVLAGAGVVAACLAVLGDPRAAAEGTIAQATGLAGSQADVVLTAFPALAAAAGGLLAAGGVLLLVASRRWALRTKYDTAAHGAYGSAPAAPAAPAIPGAGGRAPDGRPAGDGGTEHGRVDQIDGWDRLSRGDDPTR
ncbi:Trp biosynthesis-associated membrane protein [Sinomonas mesophila]|uniref:Trp biosynthesis-associated membrane protein n=1 Tax=Sinomonas mesophila TaxID=1531955 RepID=UPI0009875E28|nr:Trp biosynthesis-associated membrane protein [Sinomonas mesophila]